MKTADERPISASPNDELAPWVKTVGALAQSLGRGIKSAEAGASELFKILAMMLVGALSLIVGVCGLLFAYFMWTIFHH